MANATGSGLQVLSCPKTDDKQLSSPSLSPVSLAATATSSPQKQQRNSTRAERVIWLVCEDCGSSRRMVEPVGDPKRYFYDDDDGSGNKNGAAAAFTAVGAGTATATETTTEPATARRFPLVKA